MVKIASVKCLKCGHEWVARTSKPKACPNCKRYDWNKKELK